MNDTEFLSRYVQEGSQEAFAELVRLRVGLVYSLALRQTGGDAHRAEEVAQAVFTDLARKASSLCRHRALIGWLYTSTRYTANKMARSEQRRTAREWEAFTMQENCTQPNPEVPAENLRPLLDEAMLLLPEADRRAILLRYFDGCSMVELGRFLGLSESTAKKRVERALGKLRTHLAKRGLSSTAAAIGAALGQEAAAAIAPAGLAATISGSALVAASTAASGVALISFMTASKFTTLVGVISILGLLSIGTGFYEWRKTRDTRVALEAATRRYDAENKELMALRQNAEQMASTIADLEKEVATADATVVAAKPLAINTKEFWLGMVAAYPEVSRMGHDLGNAIQGTKYRLYFEHAGLTPAQIEEIESRFTESTIQNYGWPDHPLSDDDLRAILGDQGAQELKRFDDAFGPASDHVSRLVTDIGISASPLTSDQEIRLAAIIAENAPTNEGSQGKDWTSVDWMNVGKQAQSLLPATQWKAAEGTLLTYQYEAALSQAQRNSTVGPSPGGRGK